MTRMPPKMATLSLRNRIQKICLGERATTPSTGNDLEWCPRSSSLALCAKRNP